ncbi:MAG: lipoprotein LipL71 [Leptospira sp.]|nr:lipoprotein LipL71 [Leptospira sp.]
MSAKNTRGAVGLYSSATILLFLLVACGTPLPIQEMTKAKQEIARAEVLKADEFAKTEYDEARKGLFNAHNYAADDNPNPSEAKNSAEYALARAYDAIEKTLPRLCNKTRDEASAAIDSADVAFAIQLASEDFNKAVQLRKEADGIASDGEKRMSAYPKETDETKKTSQRMMAFDTYEKAYRKYAESKETADRAKNLALSQKQQMLDSIGDIEDNLTTAEKYTEGADPKVANTRALLADARKDIEEGKIKDGFNKLEKARKDSQEIVAASIKTYAAKRKALADEKIKTSEKKLSELDKSVIEKNPQSKSSLQTAEENLAGAKEALKSAGDLYDQEKFEDSIKQSDEAIRLADIIVEQGDSLLAAVSRDKKKGMRDANITDEDGNESAGSPDKDGEGTVGEGWKKYIVKSKVPSDCLWRIAGYKFHYGNPRLWTKIYKANKAKIKNPDLIFPKQAFDIPPKKGSTVKSRNSKDIDDTESSGKKNSGEKKTSKGDKKKTDDSDESVDSSEEDSPQNK